MVSGVFGVAWTGGVPQGWPERSRRQSAVAGVVRIGRRHCVLERPPAEVKYTVRIGICILRRQAMDVAVPRWSRSSAGCALGATGRGGFVIAWFATVVGVHFLAFSRLFYAGLLLASGRP